MQCPHCSESRHRVIDTRDTGETIRRRRQCESCGQRFTTYERVAASLLVVKSDGSREPFDRDKLLSGIQTASVKRPVSSQKMQEIVGKIEENINKLGRAELTSKVLGSMVLDLLAHVDQVAYIRFASVYLDMSDLAEISGEIDRLMGRNRSDIIESVTD